ncbi:hypothetical protein D5H75_12015 [Bailinhaonella thermotolerans]|uniref:Uncharacterized protein n=1 Tax=Bailinhaonella thermotolerans TaxID=1070861 RepID=A0A3A4B133_9ACTN|nr:hypothetical protein D5H75_12015 [Bailinhaonella thermotolerans]
MAALCLAGAVFGGLRAGAELRRGPTDEELRRAAVAEIAGRWARWPANKIFPSGLAYSPEQGGEETAQRVGVSPETSCDAGLDARLLAKLRGCRGVLRATYVDALQGLAITVGVVAFPDERAALAAREALPEHVKPTPGLRALGFPRTITARFRDSARQAATVRQAGPYLVLTTAGALDGRPASAVRQQRPAVFGPASEMSEEVLRVLTEPATPRCGAKEWTC